MYVRNREVEPVQLYMLVKEVDPPGLKVLEGINLRRLKTIDEIRTDQ